MGVRGLEKYVAEKVTGRRVDLAKEAFEHRKLHKQDFYVVVDGDGLNFFLYDKCRANRLFGGEYHQYSTCVKQFAECFLRAGVRLHVICDGRKEAIKDNTRVSRRLDRMARYAAVADLLDNDKVADVDERKLFPPVNAQNCMLDTLRQCQGTIVTRADGENDEVCAHVAKAKNCYVLGKDSDL